MKYSVYISNKFKKQFKPLKKKYKTLNDTILNLIAQLENNPETGQYLGNSCYKIRIAIKDKGTGKSGGGRVITSVFHIDKIVTLLTIYDKSDIDSLSKKEINLILEKAKAELDRANND